MFFHVIVVQSILFEVVAVDKYTLLLHIQVLAKERCCLVLLRISDLGQLYVTLISTYMFKNICTCVEMNVVKMCYSYQIH